MARQNGTNRAVAAQAQEITAAWAASVLPRRSAGAHKWSVGGLVVVAGSPAFAGAAALCCMSAGRAGAGIITAALPRSIAHIVVSLVPEVTIALLPEGESVSVARHAVEAIATRLEKSQALVIGPGLGDDESTRALLGALLGSARPRGGIGFSAGANNSAEMAPGSVAAAGKPAVLDADALNWLASETDWWLRVPRNTLVLTPHSGEMARLTGRVAAEIDADPVTAAVDAAALWGQTVVLKSGTTVVASADGLAQGQQASPALASAGTGDVLSGAIGAFLAQGLSGPDAAALAVYAGSRAAAELAGRYGTLGVVASDLPQAIASALAELEGQGA